MENETNLADVPEVEEVPVAEEQEVEMDDEGNPIEAEPEEPEPELADVEYEGKSYKLPPELKDAVLRHADYTRKTQEVAEMRRQVETTMQAVNAVTQEERNAQIAIGVIDARLADYSDIDWDTWELQDPSSAQRSWRQFQLLQQQRGQAIAQYQHVAQQRAFLTQQETAKRLEQGQRELAASIPDWGADKAAKLTDFGGTTYGFSHEELSGIDDPRMIQVLHDAWQYRQTQQAKQVARRVQPEIRPAAKAGGGKPALRGLDDRMSADEWMKARNAQLKRK